MINVKVTIAPGKRIPFIYQTPGSKGVWGNCRFFINEDVEKADWWVVVEDLDKKESLVCPPENTILITNENEQMKEYDRKFLKQFHQVITSHQTLRHPHKIVMRQGHHSHLFWTRKPPEQSLEDYWKQFKTYDELKAIDIRKIPKTKLMSVVTSPKVRTAGQQLRHRFILEMKKHFGSQLDVFSFVPNAFGPDTKVEKFKWNAIAPYKYYLALENSVVPQYWTTNMPDAHLAGAYPFYFGHPTIFEYYSQDMLTMIDINDIPGTIATIEKAMADKAYEKHIDDIERARNLWLDKYSLFPTLTDLINRLPSGKKPELVKIKPEKKVFFKNKVYGLIEKYPPLLKTSRMVYKTYKKIRDGHN